MSKQTPEQQEAGVVDINLVKLSAHLQKFKETGVVPLTAFNNSVNVEWLRKHYYHRLTPEDQEIFDFMTQEYERIDSVSSVALIQQLKEEYATLLSELQTQDQRFSVDWVLAGYREDINPVTALYYESRKIHGYYNANDSNHVWLRYLLRDQEFLNELTDALIADVATLEQFLVKYRLLLHEDIQEGSLELIHAKQLCKDFAEYQEWFNSLNK